MQIETTITNPFIGSNLVVTSVKDEGRITKEALKLMLEELKIHAENEFYVLFESGLLIKKSRSKFRSSEYLKGNKFVNIKRFYDEKV
jgi:hypothetical protein